MRCWRRVALCGRVRSRAQRGGRTATRLDRREWKGNKRKQHVHWWRKDVRVCGQTFAEAAGVMVCVFCRHPPDSGAAVCGFPELLPKRFPHSRGISSVYYWHTGLLTRFQLFMSVANCVCPCSEDTDNKTRALALPKALCRMTTAVCQRHDYRNIPIAYCLKLYLLGLVRNLFKVVLSLLARIKRENKGAAETKPGSSRDTRAAGVRGSCCPKMAGVDQGSRATWCGPCAFTAGAVRISCG